MDGKAMNQDLYSCMIVNPPGTKLLKTMNFKVVKEVTIARNFTRDPVTGEDLMGDIEIKIERLKIID